MVKSIRDLPFITNNQVKTLMAEIGDFNEVAYTEEEKTTPKYIKHCMDMVTEESETERMEATYPVQELDSICDTIVVCVQAMACEGLDEDYYVRCVWLVGHAIIEAHRKGYDLYGAVSAVNVNNLSKFPLVDSVKGIYGNNYQEASCDWIESQGRYTGVICKEVTDKYGESRVVYKSDTGKVVKWFGYVDVNLEDFI